MQFKWLLLLLFTGIFQSVEGANYYISNSGSDSAGGLTPATAWRTINAMYSVTLRPGDSLLFNGGETFDGMVYLGPNENGTATSPIVISSYGAGSATINAGKGSGIFCYNSSGITIHNLAIIGASDTSTNTSGIYIYTDTPGNTHLGNIIIDSVNTSQFWPNGIEILAYPKDSSRSGFYHIRITHVIAHDNGNAGILVWGNFNPADSLYNNHYLYIGHCTAYNNRGKGSISGSGIEISQTDSAIIEYCEAYNNGTTGSGAVGIWAWDANNITIQHCESHHNHTTGSDGDGFDLDGGVTNSYMQYNYSHDNDGAAFLLWQFNYARSYHNNTVRYNISENDSRKDGYYGRVAIGSGTGAMNSGIHNVLVYNNTFFSSRIPGSDSVQGPAITVQGDSITGIAVYNNLFYLDSMTRFVYQYNTAGIVFMNNDYWSDTGFWATVGDSNYHTLTSWAMGAHQELSSGTITAHQQDPQLTSAGKAHTAGNADSLQKLVKYYSLNSTSPMIDVGIDLKSLYGIDAGSGDFFGNTIPSGKGYDIGADEYQRPVFAATLTPGHHSLAFPNPCRQQLTIILATNSGNAQARLYNMEGKCLLTQTLHGSGQINMTNFAPGQYQLTLTSNAETESMQVVKL